MTKNNDMVTVSGGIAVSSEVADFYKNNAKTGSENLSGAMPQLKVVESGSHIEGIDGQEVPAGTFYHTTSKEVFKTVRVSIMTVSRGFRAMDNSEDPKPKFTQLLGGMILETMQPFVMFVTGTRLQNMWNFGKEMKPFTSNKQAPVPMFAFEVTLGLEKITTKKGNKTYISHVVTYSVTRNTDNQIVLIADIEVLNMLRGGVDQVSDMFDSFIYENEVNQATGKLIKDQAVTEMVSTEVESGVTVEEAAEALDHVPTAEEEKEVDDVNDEIPF